MEGRDLKDIWDLFREISAPQPQMDNRNGYRVAYQNGRPQPQRAQPQRPQPQPQRAQPQPQRSQPQDDKKSGSGFGYFVAGLVGVAAGLFYKSFLSEPEEKPTEQRSTNNYPTRNDYREAESGSRRAPDYNMSYEPTDPVDQKLEECTDLVCPITLELMKEPVISKKCGHSFEGEAINAWLGARDYCPKCHAHISRADIVPNYSLRNAIEYMRKQEKTKGEQEKTKGGQ